MFLGSLRPSYLQLSLYRLVERLRTGGVHVVVGFAAGLGVDDSEDEKLKKTARRMARRKGFIIK